MYRVSIDEIKFGYVENSTPWVLGEEVREIKVNSDDSMAFCAGEHGNFYIGCFLKVKLIAWVEIFLVLGVILWIFPLIFYTNSKYRFSTNTKKKLTKLILPFHSQYPLPKNQ